MLSYIFHYFTVKSIYYINHDYDQLHTWMHVTTICANSCCRVVLEIKFIWDTKSSVTIVLYNVILAITQVDISGKYLTFYIKSASL